MQEDIFAKKINANCHALHFSIQGEDIVKNSNVKCHAFTNMVNMLTIV